MYLLNNVVFSLMLFVTFFMTDVINFTGVLEENTTEFEYIELNESILEEEEVVGEYILINLEDIDSEEYIFDKPEKELNETIEPELNETIQLELNETIELDLNQTNLNETNETIEFEIELNKTLELNETIQIDLNQTNITETHETMLLDLNESVILNQTIVNSTIPINETTELEIELNETIEFELNETILLEEDEYLIELNETFDEIIFEEDFLIPIELADKINVSQINFKGKISERLKYEFFELNDSHKFFVNLISKNGKFVSVDKRIFEKEIERIIVFNNEKKMKIYNLKEKDLLSILNESESSEIYVDHKIKISLNDALTLTNVTYLHNTINYTGEDVGICLLDTGSDILYPYVISGYDFVNGDEYPEDDNGHGTLMTNFINAYAPGSKIYAVKVLDENGEGYISDVIKGFELCLEKSKSHKIKVISMSFGAGYYTEYCNSELLAQYVNDAIGKGISVVASTGNDGLSGITFPSCISNVTSVASSTKNDKISTFSNRNWMVDLLVLGDSIILNSNSYSGTSISAASLAGIYASYYSFNSTITPTEIENLFEEKGVEIEDYKRVDLTHTFNFTELNATPDTGNETNVTLNEDTILNTQANFYRVQRGTTTMTTATLNIPINAVNTSNSFVILTHRTAGNTPNINFLTATFTNSTNIYIERYGTTSTTLSWEVVEGVPFTVQRSGVDVASGTSSQIVSISQVNTSNSFIVFTSNMNSSKANQYMRGLFTAEFVNSTAINFTRAVTGTASRIEWQVIQFNGASVQAGTVVASTTPASVNINSVNLTNSFIISTFRPTDAQLNRGFSRVYFFNSTQIRAYRANNGGTSTVSYFVITHPDLTVQNGTSTYTSSTTATINSVQTNLTFTTSSASSNNNGRGTLSRVFSTRILTNSTQIAFQKGSNTGTNTVNWFVVTYGGDLILPNIVFVSPTPANDSVINVTSAYFNTTVNDSSGVANATLEWNGTNYTMSNSSLTNWYYNLTDILPGTYTYKAWACDFSSNCNFTETRTLTYNSTPPNLSNVFLNASSIFNSTNDNLTVTYNSSSLYYNLTNITSWYVNNTPLFSYIAPFEGGSNSTYTKDYSGNDGILSSSGLNTPIWNISGGHDGFGAYLFDGINDTLTVNVAVPTNNFTFGAWVKPLSTHEIDIETNSLTNIDGVTGQKYVFFPNHGGDYNMGVGISVGTNGITVYEHGAYYMPAIAVYNQSIGTGWSHIVVTYENRVAKIYLNGDLVHTGLTSQRNISTAPTIIGAPVYGAFNGTIDEAFVSNRVLSPGQIKKLYDTWDVIVSNETEIYDVWKACVTANDGYKDSETLCSNLTIIPVCDVYVDDDYNSSTSGWQYDHFDDLQEGINAAGEYCTVYIMNGTYYNNYTVPKPLNIIGESVENTLIDFNQTNTTGAILINSTSNVNITNLTIFNGYIVPDDDEVDQQVYSAILSYNSSSIIISNVLAYDINAGFAAIGGTNIDVSNLTVYDCGLGVGIQNGDVVSIYDVNISNCNAGFYIIDTDSENAIFENNTLSNNLAGVYFNSTNNTIIRNNIIENSESIGIFFSNEVGEDSYYNLIYNNIFRNNSIQVYDEYENYYNITKTLGANIINGSYLGGNYWDDYMGVDTDGDGLGDTLLPYNSSGNIQNGGDYRPLVFDLVCDVYVDDDYNSSTSGWQYDHFDDLQDGINAAGEYCTVYLMNGTYYNNYTVTKPLNIIGESVENTIIDVNETDTLGGLLINSTNNVSIYNLTIFNGYTSGPGGDLSNLLLVSTNSSNIFIKNILLYDAGVGYASIFDVGNIIFTNSTIYNTQVGSAIGANNDNNISFYDLNLYNNLIGHLFVESVGPSIIFENSTISDNTIGIRFQDSNETIVRNSVIKNSLAGIFFSNTTGQESYYNLIYNNIFVNNTIQVKDEYENYYNITKTLGTNIVNGPYLGGNFWDDYGGVDIDDDLLGDTLLPYNASGNIENGGDYRPLLPCVNLSDSSTFYGRIDNSSGTYNVLKNVFLCEDTYYLNTSDIVLNFSVASQNISFDCSGSRIIGNNSGVFMNSNGMINTTIKNCFVSNYETVFNFNNTLYSYFNNNHANNSGQGLDVYNTTIEIDSSIFYNNTNDGIYIDENSNISLSLSRVCSNSIDINSNTTLSLGNYNRCDSFLNWTESGRRGCALTCSDIWHRFTGKVEGNLILSDNIATFYLWNWTDLSSGNIYAVNSQSDVDWMQTYSIGRKTDNTTSSSDFEILDNILALPDSMDNINYTYSIDGSMPKITTNMTLFERDVLYIPIANSTFLGLYQTGILWDGSDAAGDEFTGSEDVIFVGEISYTATGTYVDNISYEIMLPKNFDIYTDPGAEVYFYVELK